MLSSFHWLGLLGRCCFILLSQWYHRLLIGSVKQGIYIENKYRFDIPEIGLTDAIGEASPIELTRSVTKLLARIIVRDKDFRKTRTYTFNRKDRALLQTDRIYFRRSLCCYSHNGRRVGRQVDLCRLHAQKISHTEYKSLKARPNLPVTPLRRKRPPRSRASISHIQTQLRCRRQVRLPNKQAAFQHRDFSVAAYLSHYGY